MVHVIWIILLPLVGTALGAAGVFFGAFRSVPNLDRGLKGLAAGVMTAASVWSLILPALDRSRDLGRLAFVPAVLGIWLGFGFVKLLGRSLHRENSLAATAVALHNLPEGMAVGVAAAGFLEGALPFPALFALSAGIAIQNLPEGAIISLPLHAAGMGRNRAFFYGFLSGVIEPAGAVLAMGLASLAVPVLPWLLALSAGAMLHVCAAELIPQMESPTGTGCYMAGFTLMMALDVALG